jgi:hypothetical protein
MKKTNPHFLDELEHELNGMQVLFNVWHEETPAAVRRRLRQHLTCMARLIVETRRSKYRSLRDLESLTATIRSF